MDKSLATVSPMHHVGSNNMTGKNNFNVNNQDGGVVNFNYNFYPKDTRFNAEQIEIVKSFSKEYYQLIVTRDDRIFRDNSVTLNSNSALLEQYVPPEIYKKCSSLSNNGKEFLMKILAIVCLENSMKHRLTSKAIYCHIDFIDKQGSEIKIDFTPLDTIRKDKICAEGAVAYFDLNMSCALTDLHISAWSVHKVNLFEAFKVAGIDNVRIPN